MSQSPYKILFCIGILYAQMGTWCWIFVRLGWMAYPINLHAEWMVLGFLLSFATGFLMTAIPRFLNAPLCEAWELAIATTLSLIPILGLWFPAEWVAYGGILQLIWLFIFAIRRFLKRSFLPPPSFVFLPLGISSGIGGCIFISMNPSGPGRILLYEGMMLAFVFGIGAKLVTALLGWSKPIQVELAEPKFWKNKDSIFFVEATIFLGGMVSHALGKIRIGDFLWVIVATSLGLRLWRIYRAPFSKGALSYVLWFSIISITLGLYSVALFPAERVHLMHFVYISGMALMTLMIATRVILSHGGHSLEWEQKSKSIWLTAFLFLAAAGTRILAPYIGSALYFSHLAYAAGILSFATIIWGAVLFKKMLKAS